MSNKQDYRTSFIQSQQINQKQQPNQPQQLSQQPYLKQSSTNLNAQLEKVNTYSNTDSIQPKYSLETQQDTKQYLKADNTRLNYDNKNINLHNTRFTSDIISNNQIKPTGQNGQNIKNGQHGQNIKNGQHGQVNNNQVSHTNSNTNSNQNSLFITKVSDKIYTHFKNKYPSTIDASGFNKNTITTIINQSIKKAPLNEKSINKIIEIIDLKFKMTINSDNRKGSQYNTNSFSMDEESKISVDTYLENYTNKVTILSDNGVSGEKALEADLPKTMAPLNDTIKIEKPEPFSEDFPIRDREKQTDMLNSETREYYYYVVINSNDRNIVKSPNPNEFVIEFAPAPSGDSPQSGYVDKAFHNIKACELLNVSILDTSGEGDSSVATPASFPYLLLQFDELQTNYYGTNSNLSKAFAILTDYTKTGNYKYYKLLGESSESNIYKVYNPRINLTKLTTRLLLPDGTPFNFGATHTNDTSNSCITFGLRLTTIQKTLSTSFLNNA